MNDPDLRAGESAPRFEAGSSARRPFWLLLAATAAFWIALSFYRHFAFGTALFDLGLFDQIVWNTAHGRIFLCSVHRTNFLADHFGPALALVAPLYWIASSPLTLLTVNALCVVAAAVPLRAAVRARGGSERFALAFVLVFLAYPSSTCIAIYDFHPDLLALPWLMAALYFESERRYLPMVLAALAALFCKEEYGVWLAALGLFVAATHGSPRARRVGLGLSAFAVAYLWFVVKIAMPHFSPNGLSQLGRYAYLGRGVLGIAKNLFTRPWVFFREITPIKLAHLVVSLAALAFLPLKAPKRLALAVPVWGYSLLSTFENQAFLHYQNVVPLLPPLFFSTLDALLPPRAERALATASSSRLRAALAQRLFPRVSAPVFRRRLSWLLLIAPANLLLAFGDQWLLWMRRPEPTYAAVAEATAGLSPKASLSTTNALGAHFGERIGLIKYPKLVPLGHHAAVDDVLLSFGPGGWRYSASGPRALAKEVSATLRAGYAPVAIVDDIVLLERSALVPHPDPELREKLGAMLATLRSGRPVARTGRWP